MMVVGSGCVAGGSEEVVVSRTGETEMTPVAAAVTVGGTAVVELPESTASFTPTATPTSTPTNTATPTPSPTTTPTALPLLTHSWNAEPVLIEYNSSICNDACVLDYFSALPNLILYSDGTLIVNRKKQWNSFEFQLESTILSQNEVCSLLNTIDLIGFLDYDPSTYFEQIDQLNLFPPYEPPNLMNVRAWKSNEVNAVGMRYFVEGGYYDGELEFDPPLLFTYELLNYLSRQPL
jgi:hypothetical protein